MESIELNVRRWGHGPARLLLLHGLGEGGFAWASFIRRLQPPGCSLAPDLRGHGDSAWDSEHRYDADAHTRDVARVVDSIGGRDLIVIGHSLGGEIAIRIVSARPDRFRALVMIEAGPELQPRAARVMLDGFRSQSWRYTSIDAFVAAMQLRVPLADREALLEFADQALRPIGNAYELKCDPALKDHFVGMDKPAVYQSLRSIECPVLIVRGAISGMLSNEGAHRMAAAARDGGVVTVPAAGHGVLLDNLPGLVDVVRPFLACLPRVDDFGRQEFGELRDRRPGNELL